MIGMYEGTASVIVETMIREAQQHVAGVETAESEASAFIATELAQAKAFIAIAKILEAWNQDGVPVLALK